jgi:hypothetical protein
MPLQLVGDACRRLPAALLVAALTALLLGGVATPAHAHGRGSDATNMRSVIREAPEIAGVEWRIHGGDELLELRNTSGREIVVLGYEQPEGRPYLRVGPDGVFENRNSEATYINRDRQGVVDLPAGIDASAPPDWARISDGPSAIWHDHRMHYMGVGIPLAVTDPSVETTIIERWEVPFVIDGETYVVAGDLTWIPGTSPVPWLLIGLLLALPALLGLRTEPETDPTAPDPEQPVRWPGLARPAAAVLAVAVLLNVTHLVDDLLAVPLPGGVRALAAAQTVLFLAIGAFGALRAWQAGDGAFTALGVGAGAIFVGQGLLYWDVLHVSQITSLFPDLLARITVGFSIALAIPVGAAAVIGTRRLLPPLPDEEELEARPTDVPA